MPTHQTNNNASQCQQHVPADDQKLICFDNPITKRVWSRNVHVVNMENSVSLGHLLETQLTVLITGRMVSSKLQSLQSRMVL